LVKLVEEFGDKAWVRISREMGNRSDIQCRDRYFRFHSRKRPKRSKKDSSDDDEGAKDEDSVEEQPKQKGSKTKGLKRKEMPEKEPKKEELTKKEPAEKKSNEKKKWVADIDAGKPKRDRFGFGTGSISEIFWMLHP
jgi:hypothetical protein